MNQDYKFVVKDSILIRGILDSLHYRPIDVYKRLTGELYIFPADRVITTNRTISEKWSGELVDLGNNIDLFNEILVQNKGYIFKENIYKIANIYCKKSCGTCTLAHKHSCKDRIEFIEKFL